MLTADALENRGISAVGVIHELAGAAGTDTPILDAPNTALLVSTGNAEELFTIPAPDRVIGGDSFRYYSGELADPKESLSVSAFECFCGLALMGAAGITAVDC